MSNTFSVIVSQTKLLENNLPINCLFPWTADIPAGCPTGAIPYSTYSCRGFTHYKCSNPDIKICPIISGIDLYNAKFVSKTFSNGSANVSCEYKYSASDLTEKSISECTEKIQDITVCNTIQSNFCSIASNQTFSICQNISTVPIPSSSTVPIPSSSTTSSVKPSTNTQNNSTSATTATTSSNNTTLIMGIVFIVLAVITALAGGVYYFYKNKKKESHVKKVRI